MTVQEKVYTQSYSEINSCSGGALPENENIMSDHDVFIFYVIWTTGKILIESLKILYVG